MWRLMTARTPACGRRRAFRLCVRCEASQEPLPLAGPLPSTDSAAADRLCSPASSVLSGHPTPQKRTCRLYRSLRFPAVPRYHPTRALLRSPGSRAWSFHTCSRSWTPWCRRSTREYRGPPCGLPHVRTRSAHRTADFGAQYSACVYPCQRFTCRLTTAGA